MNVPRVLTLSAGIVTQEVEMESYGVMIPLALAQICNLALGVGWVALSVAALLRLRRAVLSPGLQLAWSALAVLVPFLGALAIMLVQPGIERPPR